jgi:RHS repeat-associated protein
MQGPDLGMHAHSMGLGPSVLRRVAVAALLALLASLLPPVLPAAAEDGAGDQPSREELRAQARHGDDPAEDGFGIQSLEAASANITAVPRDASGALRLAQAMARDTMSLQSARFVAVPPSGTPHGVGQQLRSFPTSGRDFAILTTGDATIADDPTANPSVALGGGNVRGNTDYDVTILEVVFNARPDANCLRFDFSFLSEEFPHYVGSSFNDAFLAELGTSTWTTSGSAISAPNNFAFDPTGQPVTINSSGFTSMNAQLAEGTPYGGGTELLQAGTPISGGQQTLYLSIFDQGDQILDSAVFVDDLHTLSVRDPQTMCISGVKRSGDLPPLQREQTFGFGPGIHGRNPSGWLSDPVNTATGSFVSEAVDLTVPGLGVPFALTRSYNSADDIAGPLGRGWTHAYVPQLIVQPGGDVLLRGEDGQQIPYRLEDDGTFVAGPGGRSVLAFDGDGYRLTRHDQTRYGFDADGRLVALTDRLGNGLSFSYDTAGQLVGATNSAGETTTFAYDDGRLAAVTSPDGRTVAYGYTDGLLTEVTDPRGETTRYGYDAEGRLDRITDANGDLVIANTYGEDGRVVEQVDGTDARTTFTWDAETQTATMIDANGGEHRDVYADFALVERVDPLGAATRYTYDDDFNLTAITDPLDRTTTMTYDPRGNIVEVTGPEPSAVTETMTWTARNDLASRTDGLGNTTTLTYDESGLLREVREADGATTTFDRDPTTGAVTALTDAAGATTAYEHDAHGQVTASTSPLGHRSTVTYDAAGRPVVYVDPRGHEPGADAAAFTTTLDHDAAGNLVALTDPLGATTTLTYDAAGNLAQVTDPAGRTLERSHDPLGRLLELTGPDGALTTYDYDGTGNLVALTDPLGRTTRYEHDLAGRLTATVGPDDARWTYGYDAVGNLIELVDAIGNSDEVEAATRTTRLDYDELDRLVAITYGTGEDPEAAEDEEAMSTSAAAAETAPLRLRALCSPDPRRERVWQVLNPNDHDVPTTWELKHHDGSGTHLATPGESTFTVPAHGGSNVLELAWDGGSAKRSSGSNACRDGEDDGGDPTPPPPPPLPAPVTPSVTFEHDAAGNRTAMHDGAGTVTYRYDARNQLVEVARGDTTFAYDYDAVGRLRSRTQPTGTTVYEHDAEGRVVTVTDSSGTTALTYDAAGLPVTTTRPNGAVEQREHDAAGRPVAIEHHAADGTTIDAMALLYDVIGNPVVVEALRETVRYAYDDADRLVEACYDAACEDHVRYSYDAAGNRLTETRPEGTTTSTYDLAGRLAQSSGPDGTVTHEHDANGARIRSGDVELAYDLAGRLFSAKTAEGAVWYGHDGDGNRIAATHDGVTSLLRWDPNAPLPLLADERDADGQLVRRYVHGAGTEALVTGDGARFDYHGDWLGSVVALSDPAGAAARRYAYEPFGAVRASSATPGAPENPLRFGGQRFDETTGFGHLRARELDTATGRFTQPDVLDMPLDRPWSSPYAYADNRPTALIDPSGNIPVPLIIIGIGMAAGAVGGGTGAAMAGGSGRDIVEGAAIGGAIGGGAALIPVGGVAGAVVVGGTSAFAGDAAGQYIASGQVDLVQSGIAGATGATTGGLGRVASGAARSVFGVGPVGRAGIEGAVDAFPLFQLPGAIYQHNNPTLRRPPTSSTSGLPPTHTQSWHRVVAK